MPKALTSEGRTATSGNAQDPACGRTNTEVRPGYRRCVIGSHFVLYAETGHKTDIIRPLHRRLDPTRHLPPIMAAPTPAAAGWPEDAVLLTFHIPKVQRASGLPTGPGGHILDTDRDWQLRGFGN